MGNFSDQISRRDFLKFCGMGALLLGNKKISLLHSYLGDNPADEHLGRTTRSLRYYSQPSVKSKELGYYTTDRVIHVLEEKTGLDPIPAHNRIWYRTEDGWVHSGYVQDVKLTINKPLEVIPRGGLLMQVTVPFTQAYRILETGRKRAYRFYYRSTYWVDKVSQDEAGGSWYRVLDDLHKDRNYLVDASHLRAISDDELMPISADIAGKRIEVDLDLQSITAFENGKAVFTSRMSSGDQGTQTKVGEYRVERKVPTRHMAVESYEGGAFDLPGVPWVCFISWTGVSLHGTYWHNNFGLRQSHGCINLPMDAAMWVYRWTLPVVPPGEDYVSSDQGTPVIVH